MDRDGNAHVVGTISSSYPLYTPPRTFPQADAIQCPPDPDWPGANFFVPSMGFIEKLGPTGAKRYSSYLGGSSRFDGASGVAVDDGGNAYVVGSTSSTQFPATTPGALQPSLSNGSFTNDAYLLKLDPATGTGVPLVDAGPDQTGVECTGAAQALVTLHGRGCDPNDRPTTFTWTGPFLEGGGVVVGRDANVHLPLGQHLVTLTQRNDTGGTSTDEVAINVSDTAAPNVSILSVAPAILWPPDHRMVTVDVSFAVTENCQPPVDFTVSLTSNQPDDAIGTGDGYTTGDTNGADGYTSAVILPASAIVQNADDTFTATFELRAEFDGKRQGQWGEARVYTVHIVATDSGSPPNSTDYSADIVVRNPGR